ncbi:MAG TPA: 30S ribosomal protein S3 [Phycisphaerae bacterium]|nr:30S ribosomal protein S3 [Phycisphaerae bacterium]
MGQKVSPIGFRIGIRLDWKSKWFAPKSNYGEFLVEDYQIRSFIDKRLNRQPPYAAISEVQVERTREEVKVTVKTARPGLVIGPRGAEVEKLKEALEDLTNRRVNVNVVEISRPDLDAQLAAEAIAEQLKRRASFRRAVKQRAETIMQAGARGVRVQVSGRLGGAEMSRSVKQSFGSVPLQTLDADVDYGFAPSFTTYGVLGVKVWIHRGKFGEPLPEATAPAARPRRRDSGGPGRGGPGRGGPGGGGRGPSGPRGGRRGSSQAPAAGGRQAPAQSPEGSDASEGDSQ